MNSNVKNEIRRFFNKFFWRQHPETALRYAPVVSEIKKAHLENSKILEIGSGSLGITPYLKKEVDGLDIDFSGPKSDILKRIKGQADDIPFHKNTYDVSISVDVIEHLDTSRRERAIYEMLRVAKKMAILVSPEGENSEIQDKNLHEKYLKVFKRSNQFLEEHVNYGLPKKEEILVSLDKSLRKLKKNGKTRSYPNLNLSIRNILMQTWITNNKFLYYLYLKGYLLLVPIIKYCNFGKTYRRVFVIEFERQKTSL